MPDGQKIRLLRVARKWLKALTVIDREAIVKQPAAGSIFEHAYPAYPTASINGYWLPILDLIEFKRQVLVVAFSLAAVRPCSTYCSR
jgi:hypothetical protein